MAGAAFDQLSVDISVPHLVRTVRRFIDEEERVGGKGSPAPRRPLSPMAKEGHQEAAAAEEAKPKSPVTYQVSEQPSIGLGIVQLERSRPN